MLSINQILLVLLQMACEMIRVIYIILLCIREIVEKASIRNESLPEAVEDSPSGGGIELLQSPAFPTSSQTLLQSPEKGSTVEVDPTSVIQSPSKRITVSHIDLKIDQQTTHSTDSRKSGTCSHKDGSEVETSNLSLDEAGSGLNLPNVISVDHLRLRDPTSQAQESGMQCTPAENVDGPRKNQPKTPKKTPKTPQKTPKSKTKRSFRRSLSQTSSSKKSPETDSKRNLSSRSREQTPGPDVAEGRHQYDSSSTGEEQVVPRKLKAFKGKVSRTKANEEKLLAPDHLAGRRTETDFSNDFMDGTGEPFLKSSSLERVNQHRTSDMGGAVLQNSDASYKPLDGETIADPQGSRNSAQSVAAENNWKFEANSTTETESLTSLPRPFCDGDSVAFHDTDLSDVDDVVKTFGDSETSVHGDKTCLVESQSSSLPSESSTDSETRKYVNKQINQVREYCEDIARNEESARNVTPDPSDIALLIEDELTSELEEASAGCLPSPGEDLFLLPTAESPTDDADSRSPFTHSSLPILYKSDSSGIDSEDDIKSKKPRSAPTTDSEWHDVGIPETLGPSSSNDLIIDAERMIEEYEIARVKKTSVPTQSRNLQTEANRAQESRHEPSAREQSAIHLAVTCPSAEIENKGMELSKDEDKNVDENFVTVDIQSDDSDDSSLEDKVTKNDKYRETDL